MNNKKINVITLGCSKNLVDSEKLMRQVEAGGFELVHNSGNNDAATVIINTCGFINDAKQESIDTILGYVKARERGEIRDLFVMGCLSERYMDELSNEIPEVSRYFGVNNMNDILAELGLRRRDDLLADRTITGPGHYAYLKVSEGCDRTCAFCAIPLIRGKCISRTFEDIIAEAVMLAGKGVKELILVAQDLSYYGLDKYRRQALPELVLKLLGLKKFDWIRLHYLYPANFPADLIPVIRDNPEVCKYIDIPLQHITDRMLGMMKRSHNRHDTEQLLNTLRKEIPGAVIRTTLIAGHPGETEEEFRMLRDFVSSFRFDRLGVFAYSHEEDTYSFRNYEDEIAEDVKQQRVSELMEIQQGISAEINSSYVGRILKVLIDRQDGDYFIGRTEYDSPEVDQEVLIPASAGLTPGRFYDIRITQAEEFDLYGVPA
ncbi:MAG: 30S ribosomal protein S12 methylthiotransferase RimO [Bacteroidales bacterium]|jgi:ribosomal protein S12 methylthiotransferase|nr:30S ribosomal protein S12 methylthiotransferase RimO [Bacteroidales bacterium]